MEIGSACLETPLSSSSSSSLALLPPAAGNGMSASSCCPAAPPANGGGCCSTIPPAVPCCTEKCCGSGSCCCCCCLCASAKDESDPPAPGLVLVLTSCSALPTPPTFPTPTASGCLRAVDRDTCGADAPKRYDKRPRRLRCMRWQQQGGYGAGVVVLVELQLCYFSVSHPDRAVCGVSSFQHSGPRKIARSAVGAVTRSVLGEAETPGAARS